MSEEKGEDDNKRFIHYVELPNNYLIGFKQNFVQIADEKSVVIEVAVKTFNEQFRNKLAKELFFLDLYPSLDEAKQFVMTHIREMIKKYHLKINYDTYSVSESKGQTVLTKKDFSQMNLRVDNYLSNVEEYHKCNPFFYDKNCLFWRWNKDLFKYEVVDEVTLMIDIEAYLEMNGQTVNSGIKSNYIEAFRRVGRTNIPQDAPKKWIQFKDKAFSLKSKNIYDVTPDFFFTNPIPWEIGESAETPMIDGLLKDWVGEGNIQTLKEMMAYSCLTEYPIHLIFCLVGCGRNGKSKYQGLLNTFLGKDNISSTELDTLINSRFESCKLHKKLLCIMGETNFGVLTKTSLLKKLTGQDLIGFEYKNKTPFDDINYAKIVIASNSLPTSEDTSEGFYRRWLIINFDNIFPEGHDVLKDIPKEEYNNLAKMVCEVLPGLLEIGKFHNQGSIEQRKERYILASNPLGFFIQNYCVKDFAAFMRYSELYTAYIGYLNQNKKRTISRKEFNEVLVQEGLEVQRTTKKINDEFITGTFINGLRLLSENEQHKPIMHVMRVIQENLLSSTHRSIELKSSHNAHNSARRSITPESEYTEVEQINNSVVNTIPKVSMEKTILTTDNKRDFLLLMDYIKIHQKDNAVGIEEMFDYVWILELLQKGEIYENPSGTYNLMQ